VPVERSITVSAVADGRVEFFDFLADELMEVGSADIGVDLGAERAADTDRAKVVVMIMRDDDFAGRNQRADFFSAEAFVLGHFKHLRSNNALACSFKLGHIGTSHSSSGQPLGTIKSLATRLGNLAR
jgi:hypothetical protein